MKFLSQITKNRAISLLALLLALWIVECARRTYTSYHNTPLFEGSYDLATNGVKLREGGNFLDIRVNKVEAGKFYGKAQLLLKDKTAVEKIKTAKRVWFTLESLSPGPPMSQTKYVYLSVKSSSPDEMTLTSEDQENFTWIADTRKYPYDKYLFAFTIQVRYDDGLHTTTLDDVAEFYHLDLPESYRVRAQRDLTEYFQYYSSFVPDMESKNRPLGENEFLLVVDRPEWFRWSVISLISFLLIPVVIVLRTPITSASIDLIASFVSIVTIRTWLFGPSVTVYSLDFFFIAILLGIGLIQLTKVVFSSDND